MQNYAFGHGTVRDVFLQWLSYQLQRQICYVTFTDVRTHSFGHNIVGIRCSNLYLIILHGTLACAHVATALTRVPNSGLEYPIVLLPKAWRQCAYQTTTIAYHTFNALYGRLIQNASVMDLLAYLKRGVLFSRS